MSTDKQLTTAIPPEKAILVGVDTGKEARSIDCSLDELERLATTDGAVTVGRLTQRLDHPYAKTYLGSGKVSELKAMCEALDASVIIFDNELSPSQQANLEMMIGQKYKIIDRTALILDIFGLHAKTHEGKLQVQMAQLQYLYPRLRGMWAHLAKDKTRGGIGSRFGQGESQLEVDRRLIRNRMAVLREDLKHLAVIRSTQRKDRYNSDIFKVALAGYTNAGKSTLLNCLTDSDVFTQDMLFATLDPTTRTLTLPGGRKVAVTDTVGFVQKLPTTLVEAFKSTLEDIANSSIILKVVDAHDPDMANEIASVDTILGQIDAQEIPSIVVYNKIDLLEPFEIECLRAKEPGALFISAATGEGIDTLRSAIARAASRQDVYCKLLLPYSKGALVKSCRENGQIISEEFTGEGTLLTAIVPQNLYRTLSMYEVAETASDSTDEKADDENPRGADPTDSRETDPAEMSL